jgi:sigma-B regulation protein RsbU (phosphoserine phosphatase)
LRDLGGHHLRVLVGVGALAYCNAGQCPALHVRPGGATAELIRTGPPLGAFEEGTWDVEEAALAVGDVLLLYTDGVTEAQDAGGAFFGAERLLVCAQASLGRPAGAVCAAVLAAVAEFAGVPHPADDIALLAITRAAR